jgi:O-antigen ligase
MRTERQIEKVGASLAVASLVLGVIASGSRGGTLALLAGCIFFVPGLRSRHRYLMIGIMLVGGLLAWTTASESYRERIRSLTSLENDYNNTDPNGRKAIWARGRQIYRQNPVIGVGAGNFPFADGGAKQGEGLTGKWSAAHNAYLQAFVELGTIGGLLFCAILLTGARMSFGLWRPIRGPPLLHRPEFMGSLAAFATGAYFLSQAYYPPLFAILGMIALAERVRIREASFAGVSPTDLEPATNGWTGWRGGLGRSAPGPGARTVAAARTPAFERGGLAGFARYRLERPGGA